MSTGHPHPVSRTKQEKSEPDFPDRKRVRIFCLYLVIHSKSSVFCVAELQQKTHQIPERSVSGDGAFIKKYKQLGKIVLRSVADTAEECGKLFNDILKECNKIVDNILKGVVAVAFRKVAKVTKDIINVAAVV